MSDSAIKQNFIRQMIDDDLATGKRQEIVTRFPPEPNGYLHIGHAKSICLNFGIAADYQGRCTLRYDDTNPIKEDQEFVDAIAADVAWLGYQPSAVAHASDYFDTLHGFAIELIEKGLAYVDSQDADSIRSQRGTLTEPGSNSPFRARSIEDNMTLFSDMRAGKYADGEHVLRAKIDMQAANINLRDPIIYRIRHHTHQRTGDTWCIYPMYDFTHGLSDAIEGVTHSLCTLEFEDHRALYDWFLDNVTTPSRPEQTEFSRMNLDHTVMSKRMLTQLVSQGDVNGWDDPRMPTISGLRRRGYSANSVRQFISRVGVTKSDNIIEMGVLEHAIREDLDSRVKRVFGVLNPIKLVIENYPEGQSETISVANHPQQEGLGKREIAFGREIYIDGDDFMLDPPRKFFRLGPDREVRLRYAYLVKCHQVIQDDAGNVVELRCTYDPASGNGVSPDGRKVKGIIHWVSAEHAIDAEVRLYDRLFSSANPNADKSVDFRENLNPNSLTVLSNAKLEASLADLSEYQADCDPVQFERLGYFYPDKDSSASKPIFNRVVTLRDSWAKMKTS